jgi:hypothetical protein
MAWALKAIVGGGLFLGAVALFNVELTKLLDIGTCGSGNTPYVIVRPCPEGTGTHALLLTGSIFAGLIGAGIYAARGPGPRGGRGLGIGTGLTMWAIFFTATGAVSLIHSLTSDVVGPDGKTGGIIVGVTFLLMGVPALLFAVWAAISSFGERRSGAGAGGQGAILGSLPTRAASDAPGSGWVTTSGSSAPAAAPASGSARGADRTIERLERLQRLRDSGALTATEFELQKARILREG